MRPAQAADRAAPLAIAAPCAGGGYRVLSRHLAAPLEGLPAASAVCALLADAAQNFYESQPQALALHCGAFVMRGRLIALAGEALAGKSALIARLSAEPDLQVVGDDVLPILADGRAHGLGTAPRLRLPLPDDASPQFRAHVARLCGLKDDCYGYLQAPTLAPFGFRAPLSVVILLDRRAGAEAVLRRVSSAETLRRLLAQSMRPPRREEASAFAGRMRALARSVFCARLTYGDLEAAAALLRDAFDDEALPSPRARIAPALAPEAAFAAFSPEALWRRSPQARRGGGEGGEILLWREAGGPPLRLNAAGEAIWTLLEAPISGLRIARILAEAFVETDPGLILADVMTLLEDLRARGLIRPAGGFS